MLIYVYFSEYIKETKSVSFKKNHFCAQGLRTGKAVTNTNLPHLGVKETFSKVSTWVWFCGCAISLQWAGLLPLKKQLIQNWNPISE